MILVTRQGIKQTAQGSPAAGSQAAKALPTPVHRYVLAGQEVVFDAPVSALSAFQQTGGLAAESEVAPPSARTRLLHEANAKLQYHGVAPIAEVAQQVSCWRDQHILQIDVGGRPVCQVDFQHQQIQLLNDQSYDDRLNLEVVTGPALMLLLAAKGIFCLHAGAVITGYGNIALIAESGVGKSTLSAHQREYWQQLADDIVPLLQHQGGYVVGDYPQLKLPGNTIAARPDGPAAINLVLRLVTKSSDEISFKRLRKTEAMLQIVRHSVAAKLYDAEQLQAHAAFARQLSISTPVVELSYPRDLARLDAVRTAITDYLRVANFV